MSLLVGLEPTASWLTVRHSNLLSYRRLKINAFSLHPKTSSFHRQSENFGGTDLKFSLQRLERVLEACKPDIIIYKR